MPKALADLRSAGSPRSLRSLVMTLFCFIVFRFVADFCKWCVPMLKSGIKSIVSLRGGLPPWQSRPSRTKFLFWKQTMYGQLKQVLTHLKTGSPHSLRSFAMTHCGNSHPELVSESQMPKQVRRDIVRI